MAVVDSRPFGFAARWLQVSGLALGAAFGACAQQPAAPEPAGSGLHGFGEMVAEGFVNRGVRVPSFEKGKLHSLMLAEKVTRLDDERLFAEQLLLTLYGERPQEDVQVKLSTAHHHVADQILRSTDRSVVTRSDFQVEGDAMVFDAAASVGRMSGRVHTIIFDTAALSGKTEPQPQAQPPSPSQPPSPPKQQPPSAANRK